MSAATLAGVLSTALFAASVLPMVWRAARTRDLSSYSRGHLLLTMAGNLVHTVYLVTTALMLVWKLRHPEVSEGRWAVRAGQGRS